MPFEDVGTTKRRSMTPTRVLRIWEAHSGQCVNCGEQIDGTKDRWFIEHIRALELGGSDDDKNCGPAHFSCKAAKDAEDHSQAARAKRRKRKELGIRNAPQIKSAGFSKAPAQRRATAPIPKLQIAYRRPTA